MSQKVRERMIKSPLPQEGIASFIRKTYEILEEGKYNDIISWSDDGNFLVIKDAEEFSQKVLPVHFKHGNFTSFVRQLNMYNFHKKRSMTTEHIYYHELFKRGKVELLRHIKRKNSEPSRIPDPVGPMIGRDMPMNECIPFGDMQIIRENSLLKQINQDAVGRINSLETKIKELTYKNEMLLKKISEKQQNEVMLKNIFSKYFEGKKPSTTANSQTPTSPALDQIAQQKPASLESYVSNPDQHKHPQNHKSSNSPNNSDTTVSSESSSNVDSFLNLEYNQGQLPHDYMISRPGANHLTHESTTSYAYPNSLHENNFLVKRKLNMNENITMGDTYSMMTDQAASKMPCFGISEDAEEQKLNLMDFNPFFTPNEQDERHHQ